MTTLEKPNRLTGSGRATGPSGRTGGASWKRGLGLAALAAVAVGALCLTAAVASAAITPCPAFVDSKGNLLENFIESCGCTINKPGFYVVGNDLSASDGLTGNKACIDIKTSKAVLDLDDWDIDGPLEFSFPGECPIATGGVGINILKGSNNNFVEGAGAFIGFWSVGIEVDGNNNIVEWFDAILNGQHGVQLAGSQNNNVNDFLAEANCIMGVKLSAASFNQVNCADTIENFNSGVFLACSNRGATCSNGNRIFDLFNEANILQFGVGIDAGGKNNIVTDTFNTENGFGFLEIDLDDANHDCNHNLWFDNDFSTSNPGRDAVSATCID